MGNNLKAIRKLYGMSLQEVAKAIGISFQTISKYESGKIPISNEKLDIISKHFKISKEYFIKNGFNELDKLSIQREKIINESEEIEVEETDPDTGDKYIRKFDTMDETAYIMATYEINREKLLRKIRENLNNVINDCMEDQERNDGMASYEQAISEANNKISIYENIINLESKVDHLIFHKVMNALTISLENGFDSDEFTNKLIKLIKNEIQEKEKQREKNIRIAKQLWGEA